MLSIRQTKQTSENVADTNFKNKHGPETTLFRRKFGAKRQKSPN